MNDSIVKFVTDWLDKNSIKYEVLKDLSLKIATPMGQPRAHTFVGKHDGKNIWLECNNRNENLPHHFFLILCTEGHWSGK